MQTRRAHCQSLLLAPALAAGEAPWGPEWDRAVTEAALERLDGAFDPRENMLARRIGAEYRYHTSLRATVAHPTRDSLDYALLLLEAGRDGRALAVIERVTALQETDPAGKWYGLWGYYLEEPAPKMAPADWNWADFNGSLLLLIETRHGARLPAALRAKVREAIRHAAYSVRRRNVAMTYTNIAIQGTFVTLAAAELLEDRDLDAYASDRLRRFAATVDGTGSFAEYNSPTYANVSVANLTRIRMTVRDKAALELTERIHRRAWLHLAKHWHAPTRQLAGPMSRSYSTDIGAPLWIQKALGGRLAFATLAAIRSGDVSAPGEVAQLDYRCPEELAPLFLELPAPRQHREVFLPAPAPVRPVQGTTWLERDYCLGSVNRGDFWVQRRPLLGYWGGPARPARWIAMRIVKDDYDFASGLLYTAQERSCVLGLAAFRTPGGDKHPSLDPVKDGEFTASRLRLALELAGAPADAKILVNGKAWAGGALPAQARLTIGLGGAKVCFEVRRARFGDSPGALSLDRESRTLTISLDLLRADKPRLVRWRDLPEAYAAFTLTMEGGAGAIEEFDRRAAAWAFRADIEAGVAKLAWRTAAGELSLTGPVRPAAVSEQDRAFTELLDGKPVPLERLSGERLV